MSINLTTNAIPAINGGDVNSKPLVQVLDIKLIGSTQERYRLLISDSVATQHAMLATQLNDRIKSGRVRIGSVVQLIDYIRSTVQNRTIVVVLNMETIIQECGTIGKPNMLPESDLLPQKPVPSITSGHPSLKKKNTVGKTSTFQDSADSTDSFRPIIQPPYQPPPVYKNHGAIMKNEAAARIIPIAALNPYQGRWAIKARVTAKGDIRRYNNARGDGKVFSFDLLDSDGGEIRATCFNSAADRFYDAIEVGKVYVLSKGNLKPAQKNFNHLQNEWEIFLDTSSSLDQCPDEDLSIPRQKFSFRPISEIEDAESNAILDVIGVVVGVDPSVPILRKNGMETQKRTVSMKDESGRSVEVTLWGDFCNREGQQLQELVDAGNFPTLAVKAGKVNDFSGKTIGTISSTLLFVNPDFPEAKRLSDWYRRVGKDAASHSISKEVVLPAKNEIRKTISQIKDEGLGRSEKPDWITVKATVSFVKTDPFCYTACPLTVGDRRCNRKVTNSSSRWRCDRCDREFEECDFRYLLQMQVQDHSGVTWVTAFQECGEEIMGCRAEELYRWRYEQRGGEDDDGGGRFGEAIRKCLFSEFVLRLKVKEEVYGDEQRVKITVAKAEKVNYSSEAKYLLGMIS
ncbi:hypothetical protein M569_01223, partial [Genlisea aurea]